jgi:hypothetical protein
MLQHEWEGHEFHPCRQVIQNVSALQRLRDAFCPRNNSFRSLLAEFRRLNVGQSEHRP